MEENKIVTHAAAEYDGAVDLLWMDGLYQF